MISVNKKILDLEAELNKKTKEHEIEVEVNDRFMLEIQLNIDGYAGANPAIPNLNPGHGRRHVQT